MQERKSGWVAGRLYKTVQVACAATVPGQHNILSTVGGDGRTGGQDPKSALLCPFTRRTWAAVRPHSRELDIRGKVESVAFELGKGDGRVLQVVQEHLDLGKGPQEEEVSGGILTRACAQQSYHLVSLAEDLSLFLNEILAECKAAIF